MSIDTLFSKPPVIGFAAFSGTGKTSLLTALLPLITARQVRVGMIKHSHHDFEIDQPGKDSYRLRQAGASQMLIASPFRTALIEELQAPSEPRLDHLLSRLDRDGLDLVLVEGFRHVAFPKIEIHRSVTGKPFLYPDDESIIAIAADTALDTPLPWLDLNQPRAIADFILDFAGLTDTGARQ